MRPYHGHRAAGATHGPLRREHADAVEQGALARELVEGFGQVAEVEDLAEGVGIGSHVAVEEPQLLAGLGQGPYPAPERGEETDRHQRRFLATTLKPVLSSGRQTAASRFQRLRRS